MVNKTKVYLVVAEPEAGIRNGGKWENATNAFLRSIRLVRLLPNGDVRLTVGEKTRYSHDYPPYCDLDSANPILIDVLRDNVITRLLPEYPEDLRGTGPSLSKRVAELIQWILENHQRAPIRRADGLWLIPHEPGRGELRYTLSEELPDEVAESAPEVDWDSLTDEQKASLMEFDDADGDDIL